MPADPGAGPFFEPLPEPEPVEERPRFYVQLPWQPPINVVPVIVPLSLELARTDDTVVRLHGMDVYPQGVTYEVRVWLRPGTEPRSDPMGYDPWGESPRLGWLLDDGTKVGARAPDPGVDESQTDDSFHLTGVGGESGDLRSAQRHWLYPLPPGDRWVAVLEWRARGIPETRVEVDVTAVHEAAAASAGELWELPPVPEGAESGWFGYAPMTGGVYGSRLTFEPDAERIPGADDADHGTSDGD